MTFLSCPIASRFIETREDALAYYQHKLVGDHRVDVGGIAIVVRFNAEEIHLFTDCRAPCPPGDVMARAGRSREIRCFSGQRAREIPRPRPRPFAMRPAARLPSRFFSPRLSIYRARWLTCEDSSVRSSTGARQVIPHATAPRIKALISRCLGTPETSLTRPTVKAAIMTGRYTDARADNAAPTPEKESRTMRY
jgi:hypothetical protein